MHLWVHNLAFPVTVLGPGRRVALWVAGCSLRCTGCITPQLWERSAGARKNPTAVVERLLAIEESLDGLTITGGEPFEQPGSLVELIDRVAVERPHWSVLIYSGHRFAALRRRGPDTRALLERTDVLIAGPYRPDRPPEHPLAGSGNQRVHLLSDRGRALREQIAAMPMHQANLGFADDGSEPWLIGVMDGAHRAAVKQALGTAQTPEQEEKR